MMPHWHKEQINIRRSMENKSLTDLHRKEKNPVLFKQDHLVHGNKNQGSGLKGYRIPNQPKSESEDLDEALRERYRI